MRRKVKHTIAVCLVMMLGAGMLVFSASNGEALSSVPLHIVKFGEANAVVLVAPGADSGTVAAAGTLTDYVYKSTGARLPVMTEACLSASQSGYVRIFVGYIGTGGDPNASSELTGMNGDGFVIRPYGQTVAIVGPTPTGTEFGVYDFLERYVGVRWLLPGPDGEDVPVRKHIAIPQNAIREEPAAISRQFFGLWTPEREKWARFNRMHETIAFHHNMNVLFDPKKFADHPEYYPGGKVPTHPFDWQPCFSNPATVTAAVYRINQYFDANPDKMYYSLGINDSKNFCEANPAHTNYPNKLNSIGKLDMSDIYYGWVNQVAAGVLQTKPDKYFGLLAYGSVYDPPSFALNSHVIPYVTDDRMAWADPDLSASGSAATATWAAKADKIGWYDYLYGTPYALPRVYPHLMKDNYVAGNSHHVVGHAAELYPNFGEGPKAWLAAKLQWNPNQNVDVLLDDWYTHAVGAAAAPYLKQYFDYWEQFWTTRVLPSNWFQAWKASVPGVRGRYEYLPFLDSDYMNLVTEQEIADSRNRLELAVAQAGTSQQVKRAQLLLRSFDYYEAAALGYPRESAVAAPADETQALALLDKAMEKVEWAQKQKDLLWQFETDPVLMQPHKPPEWDGIWSGMTSGAFNALSDWVLAEPPSGAVRLRLEQLATGSPVPGVADMAALLLAQARGVTNLAQNPSFESGTTTAPPWYFWVENTASGVIQRTNAASRNGGYSLLARGVNPGGPVLQNVPLGPGKYGAVFHYYTPGGTQTKGSLQWMFNLKASGGATVAATQSNRVAVKYSSGQWTTAHHLFEVKPSYGGKTVQYAQAVITLWNFAPGEQVYIDDVAIYKLD
ncbi:DUF4838 domain-containing protein [Paenibacillus mesophilus]|uniref:DUF4838 domain-containing protein n=1 Tax=Paenibacillus mesophilus TaxID=2582849 RepID=UPI00110EAE42|nr:DUF4838 domain-containing protein [Paenibacillus mesophilus]TMV51636.1 DUF4838 domain-containing protein [Paenibacillus mesophilus]